jgi:MtN3 and saliva related transmembrane protein
VPPDVFTHFEPADAVGYASSAILLITILFQIHRQWASGTSRGVSIWLFVGQLVASVGFTVYSASVGDTVFVFTNAALTLAALSWIVIVRLHKRRERRGSGRGEEARRDFAPRAHHDAERVS